MNDDFRNTIKRLRDIYNYLTEGQPSPDEEEDSQKEMITLLESLIMHIPPENMEENLELLKTSLGMAKEWDTLEFWFKEKPDLVTNVKLILNRFLIRHAEPEQDTDVKASTTAPVKNGVPDELSGQLAAALERAMKNLPPDADVTKVIQSVTSQVTEKYLAQPSINRKNIGMGGVPIVHPEKAQVTEGSSTDIQSIMGHSADSINSAAARVKIRKEDIMKSVLEQVKNNQLTQKLSAPKIVIPKVTKPKQKILPYKKQTEEITATDQKHQELSAIPSIQPQEKPKQPPKLKVSAFKKGKSAKPSITTQATTQSQQPIRPKVVVKRKPKIKTKVEEVKPKQSQPKAQLDPIPKLEPTPEPRPPQPKKPKIKLSANTVSKRKQQEAKKDPAKESAIKFNVVKPTKTSVKDTQVDLFETFAKQEKKNKRRRSKKKSVKLQIPDNKPTQKQGLQMSDSKPSPMKGVEFPEESIPYEKMDKAQLYQELIALEGKKYAIEKSRSDYRAKHEKGLISDGNYAAQLDRFKFDLKYISKKINEIRQRIQTL